MAELTKGWVRLLIAASVVWALAATGIIFAEYLSPNPDYFWERAPGLLGPTRYDPNLLRVVAVIFGPLAIIWVAGWLIVWVRDGFNSRE